MPSEASRLEITVGPKGADLTGSDHLALQAAVDYVKAAGGGTVRILPGVYDMGNSLFLRSGVHVTGSGEDTILRKSPSAATPLIEDIDWYGHVVPVRDPSIFRVGGGLLLRGDAPHGGLPQFTKHTVVAIDGHDVHISTDPRKNFWIKPPLMPQDGTPLADLQPVAATLFPVITGSVVSDVAIRDLTVDGNREQNEHLDGNNGGGIFIQDCERIHISNVTSRDNHGDGISWQVCHDITIENCRLLNNADLGLHPGSGSQRPVMRGNTIQGALQGIFFCWGVKHGLAEHNEIFDSGRFGISIGHRDTDNLIRHNVIRRSGGKRHHFPRTPSPRPRPSPQPARGQPHRGQRHEGRLRGYRDARAGGGRGLTPQHHYRHPPQTSMPPPHRPAHPSRHPQPDAGKQRLRTHGRRCS